MTTCILQARTGSTRLPGKVLADLGGQPMLGFLLDRLAALRVDQLVVATSDLPQDDPVAELAAAKGVAAVRGSESDVLDRYLTALDRFPSDVVVRLTADCPLSDPAVIHAAIDLRADRQADYASNSLVRTYPVGLDVEVMAATALREAAAEATDRPEREHVTPFIYRRPERFRLATLRIGESLAGERWTVDTPADLERVRSIVARLDDPRTAGWREMLAVAPRTATEPGVIVMRPASEDDEPTMAALTAKPAAASLGAGAPAREVAPGMDDVSCRTWIFSRGSDPVAWAQVAVVGGVGRLTGRAAGPDLVAPTLACLRAALATDFQVREWDAGAGPVLSGAPAGPAT